MCCFTNYCIMTIVNALLWLAAIYSATEGACQSRIRELSSCSRNNLLYVLPPNAVSLVEHPVSVSVSTGATITFNCSTDAQPVIVNSAPYVSRIMWRFNGTTLPVNATGPIEYPSHWSVNTHDSYSQLTVVNVSISDHGYYECVLGDGLYKSDVDFTFATLTVSKRAWLNKQQDTGDGAVPVLTGSKLTEVHGLTGNNGNKAFRRQCAVSGPNQTLYWYKDGRDITAHSSGGELVYSVKDDLYGVYQCFIENSAGSDYITYRVLEQGFSNPPNNFSCRAVDQPGFPKYPQLVLSWSPPVLKLGETRYSYTVYYTGDTKKCFEVIEGTCAEIVLPGDESSLSCNVFVETGPQEFDSALASVKVNTIIQRRFGQDAVRKLSVTCPSPNTNGSVVLPDPKVPPGACLDYLHMWGTCLYGDKPASSEMLEPLDLTGILNPLLRCDIERDYSLPNVSSQPAGAVCLFGGNYTYSSLSAEVLIVPTVACPVDSEQELSTLWLNCSEHVTVRSIHQQTLHVAGTCVNATGQRVIFGPRTLSTDQEWTPVADLMLNSICTFYTINASTSPAQCIVGTPPLPRPPPSQLTPSQSTTVTPESTSPSGGLVRNVPVYVWVIVSIFVTILLLVAIVIVVTYTVAWCRRYCQRRDKNHLHYLARAVEHKLASPDHTPVDPYPTPALHGSSLSIHTDIDCLYDDRYHDDKDPTILIDKFLGCHDDGVAPSAQIVTLLVDSTEQYIAGGDQYMADSGSTGEYMGSGSSGYSSARTDNGDYYQKRLNDVTECSQETRTLDEQSSKRYVAEYFEPDSELEGYVHMVPYKSR